MPVRAHAPERGRTGEREGGKGTHAIARARTHARPSPRTSHITLARKYAGSAFLGPARYRCHTPLRGSNNTTHPRTANIDSSLADGGEEPRSPVDMTPVAPCTCTPAAGTSRSMNALAIAPLAAAAVFLLPEVRANVSKTFSRTAPKNGFASEIRLPRLMEQGTPSDAPRRLYVEHRRWIEVFLMMSTMSCVCDEGDTDTRCCCASGWGAAWRPRALSCVWRSDDRRPCGAATAFQRAGSVMQTGSRSILKCPGAKVRSRALSAGRSTLPCCLSAHDIARHARPLSAQKQV